MRMTPRVIVKKLIRRCSISSSARCCDRHALLMISWFTTMSQKNVSDNGSDWCSDTTRRRPSIYCVLCVMIKKRLIHHRWLSEMVVHCYNLYYYFQMYQLWEKRSNQTLLIEALQKYIFICCIENHPPTDTSHQTADKFVKL